MYVLVFDSQIYKPFSTQGGANLQPPAEALPRTAVSKQSFWSEAILGGSGNNMPSLAIAHDYGHVIKSTFNCIFSYYK